MYVIHTLYVRCTYIVFRNTDGRGGVGLVVQCGYILIIVSDNYFIVQNIQFIDCIYPLPSSKCHTFWSCYIQFIQYIEFIDCFAPFPHHIPCML